VEVLKLSIRWAWLDELLLLQLLYAISSPSAAVLILIYMVAVHAALVRLLLGGVYIGLINYDYASPHCPWSSGAFGLGLITRGRSGWVVNLMS
jgi:hypothetical protein